MVEKNLYFEDSNRKMNYVCRCTEEDLLTTCGKNIPKRYGFISPKYYRCWTEGEQTVVDFGSWTEFFVWTEEQLA